MQDFINSLKYDFDFKTNINTIVDDIIFMTFMLMSSSKQQKNKILNISNASFQTLYECKNTLTKLNHFYDYLKNENKEYAELFQSFSIGKSLKLDYDKLLFMLMGYVFSTNLDKLIEYNFLGNLYKNITLKEQENPIIFQYKNSVWLNDNDIKNLSIYVMNLSLNGSDSIFWRFGEKLKKYNKTDFKGIDCRVKVIA